MTPFAELLCPCFLAAAGGAVALVFFDRIRKGEAEVRQRYPERSGSLEEVRNGIYLSGTLARDYLSAPADAGAAFLLEKLRATERDAARAVVHSNATPELCGRSLPTGRS